MALLLAFCCAFVGFLGATDSGDDERDAIKAVERSLRAATIEADRCIEAIDGLADHDTPAVAELLLRSYVDLEGRGQSAEKLAHSELTKGQLSDGQIIERRKTIDPIRRVQARLLDRVSLLRNEAALLWLIEHALGDEKVGLSLKVEAVRTAGFLGKPLVELLARLAPAIKRQDDWMALLIAAQQLGPNAKGLAPAVVPLLEHPEATVREAAALTLAKLAAPEGIEPLVARLAKESGRTKIKLAAALEILTRQKLGSSVEAWRSWFSVEGLRYTSGQAELGGGEAAVQMEASGYFHGIAQDARSIVYVIDCSGSMQVSMTNPQWKDGGAQTQPVPAPPGEESRMEASKRELIKALGELTPATKFAIVFFSTGADRWQKSMVEATPERVKKAQKWVAELGPGGATNIHDAMESAFALAGRGPVDKYYDSGVDTIFLLTDGQPSIGSTKDNPERTLQLVRRLNPFQRVIVHTIGLGSGIDDKFLRRLASENAGVFVQR